MKYLEELKKLNLPADKFAVFGSGHVGIRGLKESSDIDLIVTKDLWEELKEKFPFAEGRDDHLVLSENVDAFNRWLPEEDLWNIDKLIDESDIIDRIRFVKLEEVLKWNKLRGKEKDIKDAKTIEEYISKQ